MLLARSSFVCLGIAVLGVASLLAGCQSGEVQQTEAVRFVGSYVDPLHSGGTLRLDLSEDGTYTIVLCEGESQDAVSQEQEITRGSWAALGGGVRLSGTDWDVTLLPERIPVSFPGRSDTLSGLQCTEASGPAPVAASRFVKQGEFRDFINPPGGFGTSSGGL